MKCPHCDQHFQLLYPGDVASTDKWICRNHKYSITMHTWNTSQPPYSTFHLFAFDFSYKDRSYTISWAVNSHIDRPVWELISNHSQNPRHVLIKLSFVPQYITPDNIDDKISTLLTFL